MASLIYLITDYCQVNCVYSPMYCCVLQAHFSPSSLKKTKEKCSLHIILIVCDSDHIKLQKGSQNLSNNYMTVDNATSRMSTAFRTLV